jgi:hypothetical protein
MGKLVDLTGKRFGFLLVLKRSDKNDGKAAAWVCQCRCGKITTVRGSHLRNGFTKTCGCNPLKRHGKNKRLAGEVQAEAMEDWEFACK